MRNQFRNTMIELAGDDDRLVLLFGDISVFLFRDFIARYPERFFNLGICENTITSMAAGMSALGLIPVVHTISPFLCDRSFEQIKLDLCYNGYGANIVTCGASYDYAWDGATHHCPTDLANLALLPGIEVMQPGSRKELDAFLRSQYANGKVSYFRTAADEHGLDLPVTFGKGCTVRDGGHKVTVITAGPILGNVVQASADLPVNVLYFPTIKPFDHALLSKYQHTRILVVHDAFGLHQAASQLPGIDLTVHGLPDKFMDCYGTLDDVRQRVGMDIPGIRQAIEAMLAV